jgi:hypothetical protein
MTKDNLVCRASSFLLTNTFVSSNLLLEYLMVGHWYILKTKGVPKLSPVIHHMKSPSMKIDICVGCIYFYLFEIFQQTMFCLSSKIIHLFTEPLIPYESNLSSNLLWLITLEWLRKMHTACRCLSKASWTLSINEWLADSVDFDSMNPCCSQVNILYLFKNNRNLLRITFSKGLENTDSVDISV